MNLSRLAIKRIVGTMVITTLICGLGIFFLRGQSVDMLPQIIFPLVRVRIAYPGASPEEIETNVTRRLESLVAATEDALKVVSTVSEGTSRTDIYFAFGRDMDSALNDVRARLDRLSNLPDDVERPIVSKADPSQMPVMNLGLSSAKRNETELNRWADKELSDLFMGIEGLAAVTVSGGKSREIKVIFRPASLARYELSVSQVIARLAEENIDLPGGYITAGKQELTVRLAARLRDLNDIRNVIVANREAVPIRLSQVATVSDTYADQRVMVRINGIPSVMLNFTKQPNANTVAVCEAIKKKLADLKRNGLIPEDITVTQIYDQSYYIRNSINSVSSALLIGGGLAVLVVFLFLGSIIRTVIVAAAVPISLCFTFFLMGMMGITINMISLGGLVLGVGMLLDNSIVMLENITRHQKQKADRMAAAEEASDEVGSAVVASTLTNLAAVLPFLMISGIVVMLFRDLILTISIAIFASLLTALTVVPTLASRLARYSRGQAKLGDRVNQRMADIYLGSLKPVLRHRFLIVGALLLAACGCYFCLRSAGTEFIPQIDDGRVNLSIRMPPGTALEVTDGLARGLEKDIRESDGDVERIYSSVGGFWFGGGVSQFSNRGHITIQLKDRGERNGTTANFEKKVRELAKHYEQDGAEFSIHRSRMRGMRLGAAEEDVEIKLFGPEIPKLKEYADEVMSRIKAVPGIVNLDTSLDLSRPELQITLDRQRMSDFGLSAQRVGETIDATLNGVVATRFTDPRYNEDFDVRVIYEREKFPSLDAVKNIMIYTPTGMAVRLGSIARLQSGLGPAAIERENQSRLVSVLADAAPGFDAGSVTDAARKALADFRLPEPYRMEIGGEAESIAESNRTLLAAALLALFLVFGIMAVQFESLRDPLVIMFTVPFAVMGAIFSLTVTGTAFSAVVFLGIILLIGVAVNNGIVMVNYFGILRRDHGKDVYEAVLEGAPTRLRPVLMTSITTIFGLLPLSLGIGEGSEVLVPLGIAVIGGMMLATILTLFVIPSVYLIFNSKRG
ncbi:MAG: efflux RND transporter permease subunit [Candidatus Margulisiibacteriota bacterium]